MGLCASVQSLLRTVGPTVGGFLYVNYGLPSIGLTQFVVNTAVFAYLLRPHLKKTPERREWSVFKSLSMSEQRRWKSMFSDFKAQSFLQLHVSEVLRPSRSFTWWDVVVSFQFFVTLLHLWSWRFRNKPLDGSKSCFTCWCFQDSSNLHHSYVNIVIWEQILICNGSLFFINLSFVFH